MNITTILIILAVLVILYLIFRNVRKSSDKINQKGNESISTGTTGSAVGTTTSDEIPGEVLTAIFMALHENQEVVHDVENTVLTLEPVIRNYSPWNSKIYGLRELPRK